MKKRIFLFAVVFLSFESSFSFENPTDFYSVILNGTTTTGGMCVPEGDGNSYCYATGTEPVSNICSFDPLFLTNYNPTSGIPYHCCNRLSEFNVSTVCDSNASGYCSNLGQVGALVMGGFKDGVYTEAINCSGTLIDKDLFIVAAHCVYKHNFKDLGIRKIGVLFNYFSDEDLSQPYSQYAGFYEIDTSENKISTRYIDRSCLNVGNYCKLERETLEGVVEIGWLQRKTDLPDNDINDLTIEIYDTDFSNPDYAIIRLRPNDNGEYPGDNQHIAEFSIEDISSGSGINMIGFPGGHSMRIGAGSVLGYEMRTPENSEQYNGTVLLAPEYFTKNYKVLNIINAGGLIVGSSGSGIFDDDGRMFGVLRWSDCIQQDQSGNGNISSIKHWASPISEIYKISPVLQRIYEKGHKKQVDWITGPGSEFHGNVSTVMLPYGANYGGDLNYEDYNPLLWETDIGKVITDASGSRMQYILFGDTAIMRKDINGKYMTETGSKSVTHFYYDNPVSADYVETIATEAAIKAADNISDINETVTYYDRCQYFWNPLNHILINEGIHQQVCTNWNDYVYENRESFTVLFGDTVDDCISAQPACLEEAGLVDNRSWCEHFMAVCYQQHGYYNNGYQNEMPISGLNSNLNTVIFYTDVTVESVPGFSEGRIKVGLKKPDNGTPDFLDSFQVGNNQSPGMAKSIRKNYIEDLVNNPVGVYPTDSFYVCPGKSGDGVCADSEKELMISSLSMLWNIYGFTDNAEALKYAMQNGGVGFYNFNDECRIDYADNSSSSAVSCSHVGRSSSCMQRKKPKDIFSPYDDLNLSNPNVFWFLGSKFTTTTVITGLKRDIYGEKIFGIGNNDIDYVYFLGVGELCKSLSGCGAVAFGRPTGKVYLARVPAYEEDVACTSSYQYFKSIENGVSKWGVYEEATPLYDLTIPETFIGGVVNKDGLYWMSVPINRLYIDRGFYIYSSPDGINWRLADKIVTELSPGHVLEMYGFNFMPQTDEIKDRSTIPYLYSIWKSQGGYSYSYELQPSFPVYNVALGEYEHKPEGRESRSFLVFSNNLGSNSISQNLFADSRFRVNFIGVQNLSEITDQNIKQIAGKKNVMIQYCQCPEGYPLEYCKTVTCNPSNTFDPGDERIGNWKVLKYRDFPLDRICTFSEGSVTYEYLCRMPFDDSVNSYGLLGSHFSPVWDLTGLVVDEAESTIPGNEDKLIWGRDVIMRLSFWDRTTVDGDDLPDAQAFDQMFENIKLSPYPDKNNPVHWKTTGLVKLRKPKDPSVGGYIEPINPAIELINYDTLLVSKLRRNITGPGDPYSSLYGWGFADLFSNVLMKEGSLNFQNTANQPAQGFLAASKQTFSSDGLGQTGINMALWGGSATNYQTYSYTSSSTLPEADETVLFTGELDHETGDIIMDQIDLLDFEGDMAPVMTDSAHMLFDEKNDILYLIGARDNTNLVKRIYMLHKMMIGDIERHGWVYVADFNVPDYSSIAKLSDREYLFIGGMENVQASVTYSDKVYILNLDDIENGHQITTIPAGGRSGIASVGEGINGKLYIFGGENETGKNNQLMEYDLENDSWQTIQTTFNGDIGGPEGRSGGHLFINRLTDNLLLNGGFSDDPSDMLYDWTLDLADGSWERKENHSTAGYCLNETGTLIKGGLEISGECVPFTHPWYRSFATGSTIYSVAGKGDRLYVGTNNSIKVYDISDPEALVLKSTFSTGGRIVYDLEVAEGDIMYAATSGGIYKLDTANPDTLASLSFFATSYNYQYRIQLYNDKLYVGDDNGINIRDKETFTRLAYVNIDSVLDFAIANGEIALYRSSFWSAGLHIRDVETLNLKAYEYAECYTGELTTDHGAFYLSCDGYEYRFEGRPDTYFNFYPLDGDIREMQENHVYNGWTYIPDGSSVKLSTLNDVPSYCGNGVIEEGELCDGNSVACTTISSSYVSGTAYCNSTCNGYNESNCSTDGW